MAEKLTVLTRGSDLALRQVDEALAILREGFPADTSFSVRPLPSPGDVDLATPLTDPDLPDDFFTRDLDQNLLAGHGDFAVHSAKDLPEQLPEGLRVAALLPAADIRDALVYRTGFPTDATPATIGTSSPRRAEEIRRLFPEAELKPIRGDIRSRLKQADDGHYDAVIMAACALDRLGLQDRITRYLPYEPAPQQGRLAIVTRSGDADVVARIGAFDVRRRAGLVALVGCPADAGLLSDRVRTYLDQADVVLHDRLLPDSILLRIRKKAIPVGKAGGEAATAQTEIHRRMLQESERGRFVVRLHGGDPCLYGHLAEELQFLNDWNLRSEVVPALTAAQIASAHGCTPLTHRGDGGRITFLPATEATGDCPANLPGPGSGQLALYMGSRSSQAVGSRLREAGWPSGTPVLAGQRLGYGDERIEPLTLADLERGRTFLSPTIFLVGALSFPRSGLTLFTGTDPLRFLRHGPLLHWPLIKLVPCLLEERRAALEKHLPDVDTLLFPSRFAVTCLMEALLADGDVRRLAGREVWAVGPSTADALAGYGLRADRAAQTFGGVRALLAGAPDLTGRRILYPCSDAAPVEARARRLAETGATLVPQIFYRNRRVPYGIYPEGPIARVLFTSGSTVEAYFDQYPGEREATRDWLAVGPSTLEALQARGLSAIPLS